MDGERSRPPSSVRMTQGNSPVSSDFEQVELAAKSIRISVGSLFSAGSLPNHEGANSAGSTPREFSSVQGVSTRCSTAVGAHDGTTEEVSILDEHFAADSNDILAGGH